MPIILAKCDYVCGRILIEADAWALAFDVLAYNTKE
jgi:hypothetical protein